ncbi:hypothetical protein [Pseudomonas syringae]|uniref:hypothetical protein n=1 Tax=Pseudomonas syringae TaxID=317 RepID=UPI000DA0171E|nr:hypothetical protein [Pseudomonas syringae]PYD15813.1 hypothetical protein DND62_06620 [Pseudomonas syringae pv. pisi]PYD34325.1 hypothetical protein DND58_01575 [Pseudomonas syringae pv. pisi]RML58793.1 hypothetical protein ALQ93_03439 [Pseudomonas syringae pv. pisi]RMM20598.1 hypothetical protein ALQ82_02431 [Pseudomonas syringae pv. pisi]
MTQAKERPILFSAPMVRAILSGQKTVTRRVTKVQPRSDADIGSYGKGQPFIRNPDVTKPNPECPYGRPGDRLWVRETWYCDHFEVMRGPYLKPDDLDIGEALNDGALVYAADGLAPYEQEQPTWKPSIHMPRWVSRILLEITDVRVERLNDIAENQARAEGITDGGCNNCGNNEPCGCECPAPSAVDSFVHLWDSINGAGAWDVNPWVWVVEFKRVTP